MAKILYNHRPKWLDFLYITLNVLSLCCFSDLTPETLTLVMISVLNIENCVRAIVESKRALIGCL